MKLVIAFMFFSGLLYGQDEDLARIMEDQADQEDVKEVEEDLVQLRSLIYHPVNINIAVAEDLHVFPFLTPVHIEQLMLYRKYTGALVDVKELQAIPGWDAQLVRKLLPYVTVYDLPDLKQALSESLKKGRHQLLFRSSLSRNAGLLMRYNFRSPRMEWGFNVEKDAGERLWQGSKGISFLSYHGLIRNMGVVKMFIAGDFILNLGQGLCIWQGRAVRKTAMPIMIKRQLPTVMPYRSNDENRYFRGIALALAKGKFESAFFISSNQLDANTGTDSLNGSRYVRSFLYTGYHREPSELEDKNAVRLHSAGGSITFRKKAWSVSANSVMHIFSLPVNRVAMPYNLYAFKGRVMNNYSLNVHHTWRNIHTFGEWAIDREGDLAVLGGLMMAVDPRLDLSLLVRKISRGYRSFFGNAFTESSEPVNEQGIYTGCSFRLSPRLVLDAYADHYVFPWIRYRSDAPGLGQDYLLQLTYKPDKRTMVCIRSRMETKTENLALSDVKTIQPVQKRSIRVHLQHRLNSEWEYRFRFESLLITGLDRSREVGFLFYSDMFWNPQHSPVSLNIRVMTCETGSYQSRIFAFENDVMYYNIVPGFYGKQGRLYINANINMTKNTRIFIKIARNFQEFSGSWQTRFQFLYGI